ncbi:MAG: HDOD domain-containing protein [bacterium]|nr:HDOD domain-containing protein [bacterium]
MAMQTDIFAKILSDHKELTSLPQTLAEVLRVTREEDSSSQELAKVLMRDPAMTAKVLRIANSPYYGAGRNISTVTQAVVTLGMRTVTALTLSSSVYKLVGDWKTQINRTRFWRHSLEVAIGSRMIYEALGKKPSEEAFVAGLLHDIGILVLENSFPEKYRQIWQQVQQGENLVELEEQLWGTNHARVGKFLLEQWNIPVKICEAVGMHHLVFPPDSANRSEIGLSQAVNLANLISRFAIAEGRPKELTFAHENKDTVRASLGFTTDALNRIEEQLPTRTIAEAKFLEIEIGSTDELLFEANRLLFEQYITTENLLRENRLMQQQIARDQMKKLALESLKTITATFNHYMNNATATILGRAQLIEYAINKGTIQDQTGQLRSAMGIITNGVNTISSVMEELKNLASFDTTVYHAETYILDIEAKLKKQLEKLETTMTKEPVA